MVGMAVTIAGPTYKRNVPAAIMANPPEITSAALTP